MTAVAGRASDEKGEIARLAAEADRLRRDCAEAYQVVGDLAARAGLSDHPESTSC